MEEFGTNLIFFSGRLQDYLLRQKEQQKLKISNCKKLSFLDELIGCKYETRKEQVLRKFRTSL